jgi:FAD/FMN-containing dehydrogenase
MTFANVPPVASASHVPVSGQPVDAEGLVARLEGLVGRAHVLTGEGATRGFSHGIRFGAGPVLAVVQPGSLVEQWRVLCACVAAGVIVITQAANTGLTGGSTPDGTYDRPVVIISTRRLHGIHLIDQGRQVVCLPGATLYELEALLRPLGREPHSVIGSSCIGASVMGASATIRAARWCGADRPIARWRSMPASMRAGSSNSSTIWVSHWARRPRRCLPASNAAGSRPKRSIWPRARGQ